MGLFFNTKVVTPEGYQTLDPEDEFEMGKTALNVTSLVRKESLNYAAYYSITDMFRDAQVNIDKLEPPESLKTHVMDESFKASWKDYMNKIESFIFNIDHRRVLSEDLKAFPINETFIENETFINDAKGKLVEYNQDVIGCMMAQLVENITTDLTELNVTGYTNSEGFKKTMDILLGVDGTKYVNEAALVGEIEQIKSIQRNGYLFGKYMGFIKGSPEENRIPDLEQLIVSVQDDVKVKDWCEMFPKTTIEVCHSQPEPGSNAAEGASGPPPATQGVRRRRGGTRRRRKTYRRKRV